MKKIIVTQDQIDNMVRIHKGENSSVYELNGNVYKIFSDKYKEMSDESLLMLKLEMADALTLPGIIIPNGILFNEEKVFTGARYSKKGSKFKLFSSDLQTCTKRHIGISKILQNASSQGVILTDFRVENLRLKKDGTILVIDYDGMQIGDIPSCGINSDLYNFLNNNFYNTNLKYLEKDKINKYNYNFFSSEVNIFNSIYLYLSDCLNLDICKIIGDPSSYISSFGIKEDDINHKIWKLFSSYPNEYFTDDEFNLINERYELSLIPETGVCKCFVRK